MTPALWSVLPEYYYLHARASESERPDHIADAVIRCTSRGYGGFQTQFGPRNFGQFSYCNIVQILLLKV